MKRIGHAPILMALTVPMLGACGSGQQAQKPGEIRELSDLAVHQMPSLGISFASNKVNPYPRLAASGMEKARVTANWSVREPEPDKYDWTGFDKRIQAMEAVEIEPFVTFASDAGQYCLPSDCSGIQPNRMPQDLDHWSRFVRALVERYDGDGVDDMPGLLHPVKLWQGANEFTNGGCNNGGWAGTPAQFVELTNATYDAVKAADPDATFSLGGIAAGTLDALAAAPESDTHRQQLRTLVGKCRFDMLDAHLYGPEDRIPARIAFLHWLAPDKPICATEAGGPSLDVQPYSPEAHFKAALGINLQALAQDVKFTLWFRSNDGGHPTHANSMTALWKSDGTPKPAYWAYYLLAHVLDGYTSVSGQNPYRIKYADGTERVMAWGSGGQVHSNGPGLRVVDVETGSYEVLPAGDYEVGDLPVVTDWAEK